MAGDCDFYFTMVQFFFISLVCLCRALHYITFVHKWSEIANVLKFDRYIIKLNVNNFSVDQLGNSSTTRCRITKQK